MTREGEIKQAAKLRADQYEHPADWNDCYHHFIDGAKWADANPSKEFVDINKVIKWLSDTIQINQEIETDEDGQIIAESYCKYMEKRFKAIEKITNDFRKAVLEK